eukprot:GHVP01000769.1.p1 GENE.GHVP01000769.1~~GHVP01000769.1.p1  ORF type:complete len:431 (+),score=62.19 GHVP01000769.1:2808-4100(+)
MVLKSFLYILRLYLYHSQSADLMTSLSYKASSPSTHKDNMNQDMDDNQGDKQDINQTDKQDIKQDDKQDIKQDLNQTDKPPNDQSSNHQSNDQPSNSQTGQESKIVFKESSDDLKTPIIKGINFSEPFNLSRILDSYITTGFQASNLGKAIQIVKKMRSGDIKTKIYLGYTSNLVSSGLRDIFCYLTKNRLIDFIVTTGGGIEEDFIKCMAPTHLGSFNLDGTKLYEKGYNRIGNLLIPNNNYCLFEAFLTPIINQMHSEQENNNIIWTPSKIISRLGMEIKNKTDKYEESIYYWAYKNNIPIFCPGIIDGSIGDIIHFHSMKRKGFIIDTLEDLNELNNSTKFAEKTGMIILGGGIVKHQICNANLMRNGADYSVFINTGIEHDGSDSGASPDEAVSWGKISTGSDMVKVWADATLVFPLLVAECFVDR